MKSKALFVALWFMNFMAGIGFCCWGHHVNTSEGEFLLLYFVVALYLGAGLLALLKWEMDL